jgi:hypothetical protein
MVTTRGRLRGTIHYVLDTLERWIRSSWRYYTVDRGGGLSLSVSVGRLLRKEPLSRPRFGALPSGWYEQLMVEDRPILHQVSVIAGAFLTRKVCYSYQISVMPFHIPRYRQNIPRCGHDNSPNIVSYCVTQKKRETSPPVSDQGIR